MAAANTAGLQSALTFVSWRSSGPCDAPEESVASRSLASPMQSGVHVVPPRDDPSLVLLGVPSPGAPVVLRVHGEPGDWVRV